MNATLPIFKFLRRTDTGSPTLGKLYSGWFELGEFLKGATSDFKKVAVEKWLERWAYGHRHVAAAAYVLDPEFHAHDQASNTEVTTGYMHTLEKVGILLEVRRRQEESPGELEKAWKVRSDFIAKDKKNWESYLHYPKYPTKTSPEVKLFCRKCSEQLHHVTATARAFSRLSGCLMLLRRCQPMRGGTNTVRVCLSSRRLHGCCLHNPLQPPFVSVLTQNLPLSRTPGAIG